MLRLNRVKSGKVVLPLKVPYIDNLSTRLHSKHVRLGYQESFTEMELINVLFWLLLVFGVMYLSRKWIFFQFLALFGHLYNGRMRGRKKILFQAMEQLKADRGDGKLLVLEIGCGAGMNFEFLPSGSEVICIDPNGHFEKATYRAARQVPRIRVAKFHVCPAENMREWVETGSMDAVISTLVFCSVKDTVSSLQEAVRVLKPVSIMMNGRHLLLALRHQYA